MWILTIVVVALVVVVTVAACIAAHRRGRRHAAHWRATLTREDALPGGKA
jgi:heme/copper-type cytochrome/quinol oxidase subunit 2